MCTRHHLSVGLGDLAVLDGAAARLHAQSSTALGGAAHSRIAKEVVPVPAELLAAGLGLVGGRDVVGAAAEWWLPS